MEEFQIIDVGIKKERIKWALEHPINNCYRQDPLKNSKISGQIIKEK